MHLSALDRLHRPRHRRRRRFRTRLLVGMLAVGLLPLALLAAVVVADLGSVSRTTTDAANTSLIAAQESDQQRQVADRGRLLQVAIDGVVGQLQGLRQRVADALRSHPDLPGVATAPLPAFESLASLRFLHDRAPSGTVSTVLVATPAAVPAAAASGAAASPHPGLTPPATSPDASLANALAATADAEAAMEAARNAPGVHAVWISDSANGLVRTLPDLDVASAVGSGALDPIDLVGSGDAAPFSALVRRAGGATGTQQPWDGEGVSPTDVGVHPNFTATYPVAAAGDLGVTVWEPVSSGSHDAVGLDLDVRELVASVSDTPVTERHGASTVLLAGGDEVLGASPGAVTALGLSRDYVGTTLARAAGGVRAGIDQVLATGSPLHNAHATLGGADEELFTAPIRSAHWVLVSAVPYADLVPDQTALSQGVDSGVRRILRDLIPLTLGAVLLAGILAGLAARRATGPLRALTAAAERLGSGDTAFPVPPQGRDEFGLLAQSLERMRREVNASHDAILGAAHELEGRVEERTTELRERNEELVSLNRLAGSLTRSLDADAILAGGLESLGAFLPLRTARGYVIDEGRLRSLVSHGDAAADTTALNAVASAALEVHDLATRDEAASVLVGLPLETRDGALGAIALRVDHGWHPGGRSRALLRAVADQVGLALRTAKLSAEGRELAVLEERTRLAREIHDTLAQQLTAIVLQLEIAEALVERDEGRARGMVVAARDQARFALQEARRSVWNLRPQRLEATGLAGAVAMEATRFAQRSGIQVRVQSDSVPRDLSVTPQAEVAVFRILQEALTNAERHSRAGHVDVGLAPEDGHLVLTISDDGDGFDAAVVDRATGSFGLVGMEERARLIGATLRVVTAPGQGTRVEVHLPVVQGIVGAGEPAAR